MIPLVALVVITKMVYQKSDNDLEDNGNNDIRHSIEEAQEE